MPHRAYVLDVPVFYGQRRNGDHRGSCSGDGDSNRTLWRVVVVGCRMIWMLPVPVFAVTLAAVGMQLRATRLFDDFACQHRRINHSLSRHFTARRSLWRYLGPQQRSSGGR
jgi:hypothetical protein